jgi:hypothetical protein
MRAVALVLALVATACGAPAGPAAAPSPSLSPVPGGRDPAQRYEVVSYVLEDGRHGPELCVWAVAESLPPQCGGLPVEPFSWDDIEGEESVRGVTWHDSVRFVGTWDGTTFHVTEPPRPAPRPQRERPDHPLPCPDPSGGWRVVDPSKVTDENAAVSHARKSHDVAGIWLHWLREPTDEEARDGLVDYTQAVLVLTFTGDIARHEREARERWGGPLCVAARPYSYAELEAAGERLQAARDEAEAAGVTFYDAGADEPTNAVEATVLIADEVSHRWFRERLGTVPFRLDGILRPV